MLAYPFAFAMSRLSFSRQKMMTMLVMLPMWMNFLLRTYAWQAILEDNGVINTILNSLGLSSLKLINTSGAVVLGMVYNYIPFMILPLYSIMTKIDKSLIEAAGDLGAGFFATFRRVVLPLSMPGIISGTTMVFVPAVSTFVISGMLGGTGNYLIGDLIETLFCRVTGGVWMSRSSVIYGTFSIVWGFGAVILTVVLQRLAGKEDRYFFLAGSVLGGVYEYVCSAVTELLFGTVFWDYSGFKFNLGGRINLLYCFFWGIAAVTWIRYGYPLVAKGMKAVKRRIRPWMTALLAVFMAVNLVTSALALARYDARTSGAAPANAVDVLLDEHFDNARMERIYPNAKKVEKAG